MTLPPRVAEIIRTVAEQHGFEPAVLVAPRVGRGGHPPAKEAAARRHAMIECRRMDWLGKHPSYPLIGRWFNRTHGAVMDACRDMQG